MKQQQARGQKQQSSRCTLFTTAAMFIVIASACVASPPAPPEPAVARNQYGTSGKQETVPQLLNQEQQDVDKLPRQKRHSTEHKRRTSRQAFFYNQPAQYPVPMPYQQQPPWGGQQPQWGQQQWNQGQPQFGYLWTPNFPIFIPGGYPNFQQTPQQCTCPNNKPQDTTTENTVVDDRFGMMTTVDDRPVWDMVDNSNSNSNNNGNRRTTTTPRPNRPIRTKRPTPPLIHNSDDKGTPPDEVDLSSLLNSGSINNLLEASRPTTTTPAPMSSPSSEAPTRCVWAIVSCCTAFSDRVRYTCFENLGCDGAFWDFNPCSTELAKAAIKRAQQYYQQSN